MSYQSTPVAVPETPGKITFRKIGDSTYVQYETGRIYDAERKYNTPSRKVIGQVVPCDPRLMRPNENYYQIFGKEGEGMNAEEQQAIESYEHFRDDFRMMKNLFDQTYFEFMLQAHKSPREKVSAYRLRQINQVLDPLREMMAGEPYGKLLERIEGGSGDEEGTNGGPDHSDVALMMARYKFAVNQFADRIR